MRTRTFWLLCLCLCSAVPLTAKVEPYAGALGGLAILSADAGQRETAEQLTLSSYSPENGPALNIFVGAHFNNCWALQANYIWNGNDLALNSAGSDSGNFYVQHRGSSQQAFVLDVLIYFRDKESRMRPYLSAGPGVVHLSSTEQAQSVVQGGPPIPSRLFASNRPVLRVAVGMDVALSKRLALRYSFSESIGHNDISSELFPPGKRRLANFQNLFGFLIRF